MIPFNKPYLTGKETRYLNQAVQSGHISGNGIFTRKCQHYFEEKYGFGKCLLTTSCTAALEMAALLCDIKEGDEVIMPSFTFVSTANAFVLRGAKIIFADSRIDHPGIDEDSIEELITRKTKAIVIVHYAGVACDMDKIMNLANKYGLLVVEDAAHAVDSNYTGNDGVNRVLGSIGHFATFSFHETKNITCGEGGMLVVNDKRFQARAEVIWEKGTNRSAFFRGEVDKYSWVDLGSSFLLSEINASFLWAQIENLKDVQARRTSHWNTYQNALEDWAMDQGILLATIPDYASNNAHMFYMVCQSLEKRMQLLRSLNKKGIEAVFHYQSLHKSPYYRRQNNITLPHAERYSDCLLRLPMFYELAPQGVIDELLELKIESRIV